MGPPGLLRRLRLLNRATPSISPATGTYTGTQQVTISDATSGATIYYTIDGTVPTASSTPYTSAISISASATVQAIAILGGASSSIASSTLTINPAHPPSFQRIVVGVGTLTNADSPRGAERAGKALARVACDEVVHPAS